MAVALSIALVGGPDAWANGAETAVTGRAERTLMNGHVDEALRMLQSEAGNHPGTGPVHLLLCRAYFSELAVDKAVPECEVAVSLMPNSSAAEDWMGRAYGVQANDGGPLKGLKLAHKVHEAFEAAVALDPRSAAAADDLAEYYIGAPGLVGGGLEKADALANRIAASLPQSAHRIRAMAAEKRKDYGTAEREFEAAVGMAHSPNAWVDLGGYYKRRGDNVRAVNAFHECLAADRARDAVVVDVASYLMEMHTEPATAMRALQGYLAGEAKSDDAPVVHVEVLLAELYRNQGNAAQAKIELMKALSLAADYAPAKRDLQGLQGQ